MVPPRRFPEDPWPAGPQVPGPLFVEQSWVDAIFLHWRVPAGAAARHLPPGVEPDVFCGSSWVGLIGFRMRGTRVGTVLPVPYLGSFTEINVRLYSRGRDGSRGVVFLSLDAARLLPVLGARFLHVPYVWSRCRPLAGGAGEYGYDVGRRGRGAHSRFAVLPDRERQATDPLSLELTARFGLHARIAGRTVFIPNSHRPWPLYPAELTQLEDQLVAAAGITVAGPPESVLFSPGVRTVFGRPSLVEGSGARG